MDYLMVVQNGVNKKLKLSALLKTLDSTDNILLNPSRNPINIRISSSNSLSLFYINGSSDFVGINTDTPLERFHVNGNIKVGDSVLDGVILNSSEDSTFTLATDLPQGTGWFKPINAAREVTSLTVEVGVGTGQFTLGNGLPGQYKTITSTSLPSGSKAVVSVVGGIGFNSITFNSEGSSIILRCILVGGLPKWICVGNYLTILTTV